MPGRERERERAAALAILAQVDLPFPGGGTALRGCWLLPASPSGGRSIERGRLEPHNRCHLASVAFAGNLGGEQ